jgi:isopentenyl-diphosphate Delta-isomerase
MTENAVELVELVSDDGVTTGTFSKLGVHVAPGLLHRAVSVVIFDGRQRVLLQRRASGVYHFANRWSNTCCTHPRPDEDPVGAAQRRLFEEMGITVDLTEAGIIRYRADDPVSGLVENEYDHVFTGTFTGTPLPERRFVSDWQWVGIADLYDRLTSDPTSHTPWLPMVLDITTTAWPSDD